LTSSLTTDRLGLEVYGCLHARISFWSLRSRFTFLYFLYYHHMLFPPGIHLAFLGCSFVFLVVCHLSVAWGIAVGVFHALCSATLFFYFHSVTLPIDLRSHLPHLTSPCLYRLFCHSNDCVLHLHFSAAGLGLGMGRKGLDWRGFLR
jgi:hypothetical protein